MYDKKKIIKSLTVVVSTQVSLFIGYYLYMNFIKEDSRATKAPFNLISTQFDIPLPTSLLFDKIREEIVKKSMVKKEPKADLDKKLRRIAPSSSKDIVTIKSKLVKPILYTNSIPLSSLSTQKKKQKFIDMMIPSILVAKHKIKQERERVAALIVSGEISKQDKKWLAKKREEFRALNNYELYNKMELHPTSIIIAQAIIESGWGTSKFFQKANNVFGVWSFSKQDNRIAASQRRGDRTIYLKKYKSMEESIYDYLLTIARKGYYKEFQKERLVTKDPYKLVNYLIKYSERGKEYTKDLKNMIKQNRLIAYDSCKLDLK
jgi:Bax protein